MNLYLFPLNKDYDLLSFGFHIPSLHGAVFSWGFLFHQRCFHLQYMCTTMMIKKYRLHSCGDFKLLLSGLCSCLGWNEQKRSCFPKN